MSYLMLPDFLMRRQISNSILVLEDLGCARRVSRFGHHSISESFFRLTCRFYSSRYDIQRRDTEEGNIKFYDRELRRSLTEQFS